MNFSQIKKIHCIGIGGIGVSAVAKFFLAQGKEVSGSDVAPSEITEDLERRGVKMFYGHRAENVADDIDLAIYSPAVPPDNPERLKIKRLKDCKIIEELSYPEFLGELSKDYYTIAISGTHGKSTTTALIGLMLEAAGFDPLVIVGSKVPGWELGNIRLPVSASSNRHPEFISGSREMPKQSLAPMKIGVRHDKKQNIFTVEACEHQANMLKIHPQVAVITNIEADHLDYYKSLENIQTTFGKFIASVPEGGLVVVNNDNEQTLKALKALKNKIKTFGINSECDFQAKNIQVEPAFQKFVIHNSEFVIHFPGQFNVYNVLAAIAVALELGVPIEICQRVLANFRGLWRRFEIVGLRTTDYQQQAIFATIISDYGHHPTAIRATLRAAREFYPGRRIVLVFQPHQHHRTKSLFEEFVKVLSTPDLLILSEIYEVAGREESEDQDVSSAKILERLRVEDTLHKEKYVAGGSMEQTEARVRELVKDGDVVMMMGAGDIDKVARHLIQYPSK